MLRIGAALGVMGGCAYLGNVFAMTFKHRHRQLAELSLVVKQLEFDIEFLGTTLVDSLGRISSGGQGVIYDIVGYVHKRMKTEKCVDMEVLWRNSFERFRDELSLKDDDVGIMLDFAKKLGKGDRERERNNIRGTLMRLKVAEDQAAELSKGNVKMYRGMGILSGIFIVIVLI